MKKHYSRHLANVRTLAFLIPQHLASAILFTMLFPWAGFLSPAFALTVSNAPISQVFTGGVVGLIARQSDGKVIIAGYFEYANGVPRTGLARLNADGSLDTAWNPIPTNGSVDAILVDSSDNLYVGGSFKNIGGQARNGLARLSSSGAVDPTWNPVPPNLLGGDDIMALALDPSGSSLYVGGNFTSIGGQTRQHLAKISTSGSGTADPAWNPNPNSWVSNILVGSGGNLYLSGGFTTIGGFARAHLAKISGAGAVDAVWDPNPTPGTMPVIRVERLALDPLSGDIYVGGVFGSIGGLPITHLAKISSSGTGAAVASWNPMARGEVTALAVDANGNVYTGGLIGSAGGQNRNAVKLSGTTAVADAAWDPLGGWTATPFMLPGYAANSSVYAFAMDGSGNVLAGGIVNHFGGLTKTGFALLSGSGTGAANPAWASVQKGGTVKALARDGAGRTIIGGDFFFMGDGVTIRNNIARLNSDTTLDTTWAPEANGEVAALAVDGSDNVYAAGSFTSVGGLARNALARLAATGGVADANWNPSPNGPVAVLALDGANGYLFAGGNFGNIGGQARSYLAKISTSGAGAADANWNPSPSLSIYGFSPSIGALTLDGGGNLYVGGSFTSIGGQNCISLAKLSTSGVGAADANWHPDPTNGTDAPRNYAGISALALDGGGSLYVGGSFTNISGQARSNLARLATTGTGAADPVWNPGANGGVNAIVLDGKGHAYVGGSFTGINSTWWPPTFAIGGSMRSYLARLFTSGAGTADCHWIPNVMTNYSVPVYALALDSADKLYVGGGFGQVAGSRQLGFAELTGETATGCKLAVTNVNSGYDPSGNYPFNLTAQSQDSTGQPQTVVGNTMVGQSVKTGTGTLSGATTCQIAAGAYTCTLPGLIYSAMESGVVLTSTRSSGDPLDPGDSPPINFIAATPPSKLAVIDVNGGQNPVVGSGFPITVQLQDANGRPAAATVPLYVGAWACGVAGVTSSTSTAQQCNIAVGASGCTMTGITYSRAETGVVFTLTAFYSSGSLKDEPYLAGNSQPITVDESPGGRSLTVINTGNLITSTPAGINCGVNPYCTAVFPTGSSVTLQYTGAANTFGHWIGDCGGTSPSCTLTMDTAKTVSINVVNGSGSTTIYTYSQGYQCTTAMAGTTNQTVNQTATRLLGRYHGSVVCDRTFNAPFTDPLVQAAVKEADDAVRAAAGNTNLVIGPPVFAGTTDQISTATSYSDVVTEPAIPVITTNSYIGPQTNTIGFFGNCDATMTSCSLPAETLTLAPGQLNFLTRIVFPYSTSRTIVNTETHLLTSTYVVGDSLLNSDADLGALAVSSGALTPAFASAQFGYSDSVTNDVTSITVTPTLHDPAASVLVNGMPVASGSASSAIPLTEGSNLINVVVTAQDGATTRSYTITVTRAAGLSVTINQVSLDSCPVVRSYVSVSDHNGDPVTGLTSANFTVKEDSITRTPVSVSFGGTASISIAMALDYSGSMSGTPRTNLQTAATTFINQLGAADAMEIIKFSTAVEAVQTFTTDKALLAAAVTNTWSGANGSTAFYDAVYKALTDTNARSGRKAVIAMTDGDDTVSTHTIDQVITYATSLGIPVYTIGLGSANSTVLSQLANSTNGHYYNAPTSADLQSIYSQIANVFQNQYEVTYASGLTDGAQHTLEINVNTATATGSATRQFTSCSPSSSNFVLSVAITGTGSGSVHSSSTTIGVPGDITCTMGTCSVVYPSGSIVNLGATPSSSSTFDGWSGACTTLIRPLSVNRQNSARTTLTRFFI